ncbi:hypothetical protein GmHk_09G025389 [Glycine max]|nr:hypothetical protein GmHk_09G025389 [Glycine max]
MYGNRLPAFTEHFDSNFNACNRLPEEIFRKLFPRVTTFQMVFTWPSKVYLYVTWNTYLLRVFQNKKSYPLKKQNHFILLRIPWPIHLQFNKKLFECSNCSIYLFQERFHLLFFLNSQKGLRDRGSLVVKKFEHKGRVVLVWFRTCKGILQDSGTLKWVAWGLDLGSRVWPNHKINLHYYLGVLV